MHAWSFRKIAVLCVGCSVACSDPVSSDPRERSTSQASSLTRPARELVLRGDAADAAAALREFLALVTDGQLDGERGRAMRRGQAADWSGDAIRLPTEQLDLVARSSPTTTVGRVTWNEPGTSIEQNAYYFLVLESAWRIEALRASVVPSFVRALVEGLDRQPEAVRGGFAKMVKDAASVERELERARRDLYSDQQLRAWFTDHRAALERIAERVRSLESGKEDQDAELRVELDAVGLRSAWMLDGGRVEITVGGWADNHVGFGHAPDRVLPAIDADRRIWVEELGEGWYLYRET